MWTDAATPLSTLKSTLDEFNQARDWGQFHTPKDLAMCISAESGELLECFLWTKDGDKLDLPSIEEELADLLITVTNLASQLGVDLMAATQKKIEVNGERYPVEKAKGRATKHSDL